MLTRDLLRYKAPGGKVMPQFIDPADPLLLAFASSIVKTYRDSLHFPKNEIEESLAPLLNSLSDRKLAAGLLKLYDDRCEYSGDGTRDWHAMRRTLFAESSRLLETRKEGDAYPDFRTDVFAAAGESVIPLSDNIYADLPDFEQLTALSDMTPEFLLEKYNAVLVQSLVIYADSLLIRIEEPDSAKMRRFFKYLRFFRLLADVAESSQWSDDVPGSVSLKIDGPASILDNSAKYGLQLAAFLPALFSLSKWKFSCELNLNGKRLHLTLDETSGLNLRFGRLGIHIPEEVKMFASLFQERVPQWLISSESPFLRGKRNQDFVFPDMMFRKGRRKMYLELFHRWHARQLESRLEFLLRNSKIPLVLGVERQILSSNPLLKERVESHALFGKRIFLFRDFPSIEKMKKILENG